MKLVIDHVFPYPRNMRTTTSGWGILKFLAQLFNVFLATVSKIFMDLFYVPITWRDQYLAIRKVVDETVLQDFKAKYPMLITLL